MFETPSKAFIAVRLQRYYLYKNSTKGAAGQTLDWYVDCREMLKYPNWRRDVAKCIGRDIDFKQVTNFAGMGYGAMPLLFGLSDESGASAIMIRPEPKEHGMHHQVEGRIYENDHTVLVDDVLTTGTSMLKALEILRKHDVEPKLLYFLVDRSGLVDQIAEQAGIPAKALLTAKDLGMETT